jgi:aerobic carbon-monoxide dehydrogenase medium subunit
MKAAPFSYVRATSVGDALRLLAEHGGQSKLIAGGQSLLASLAFRLSEPSVLIDISKLGELRGVNLSNGEVRVGAATTHSELGCNEIIRAHAPLLADAILHIAHPAIRNRGTIGGSLAYADPAAELPACCLALEAQIIVASAAGERRIPAASFFTGLLETALADGEMIVAVAFPARGAQDRFVLYEIARRSGDYAMAGVAIRSTVTGMATRNTRLAFFGLADTAVLAPRAAATLDAQGLTRGGRAAAKAALAQELQPNADQHGSADMKRHLAGVVLERALAQLAHTSMSRGAAA